MSAFLLFLAFLGSCSCKVTHKIWRKHNVTVSSYHASITYILPSNLVRFTGSLRENGSRRIVKALRRPNGILVFHTVKMARKLIAVHGTKPKQEDCGSGKGEAFFRSFQTVPIPSLIQDWMALFWELWEIRSAVSS